MKRRFSAKGRGVRPVARSPSLVHLEHFLYSFAPFPRHRRATPSSARPAHAASRDLSARLQRTAGRGIFPGRASRGSCALAPPPVLARRRLNLPRGPPRPVRRGTSAADAASVSPGPTREARPRAARRPARSSGPSRAPDRVPPARSRASSSASAAPSGLPSRAPFGCLVFSPWRFFSPRFERQLPFAPRDDARAGSPRGSPRGSRSRAREDRDAGTRGGRVRSRGARRRRRGVDGPFNFRAVAVRTTSGRASADSAQINVRGADG